jgi:hypothetical protein
MYEEMGKYLTIYEEAVSHIGMTLQPLPSELPYVREKFPFLYQCGGILQYLCLYIRKMISLELMVKELKKFSAHAQSNKPMNLSR